MSLRMEGRASVLNLVEENAHIAIEGSLLHSDLNSKEQVSRSSFQIIEESCNFYIVVIVVEFCIYFES